MLKNAISGVVLLALSIAYYLAAVAMPSSILDTTVTSAAFPELLAIGGAVLSVALIVQSLVAHRFAAASIDDQKEAVPAGVNWHQHLRALGLLIIVVLFIVAIEVVGYPVAVGLLIFAVSIYQGYPISKMSFAVAIGGALFFWLFFMVLLGIHLPLGVFQHLFASTFPLSFA